MRIDQIEIKAYLGVPSLTLNLDTPVTLIAGPNAAGKSSVAEAVRHALLGQATRVRRKADYPMLLTAGHQKGQVKVAWAHDDQGGAAGFRLPKGDNIKGSSLPQMQGLDVCLGATPFMGLSDQERRRTLMRATGVQANSDDVVARLKHRGVSTVTASDVAPMLRSGFDAARQYAESAAKGKENEWRQVTSEAYGHSKAEDWVCEAPKAPTDADVKAAHEALHGAREDLVHHLGEWLRSIDAEIETATHRVNDAQAALAGTDYAIVACPSCGTDLVHDADGLHETGLARFAALDL